MKADRMQAAITRPGAISKPEAINPAGGAQIGVLEWFRPGEYDRVGEVLSDLKALGVRHLRTGVSWADWHAPGGREWYEWLLPKLGQQVDLLPCFVYTPPSLGIVPKTSSPPREPELYAHWIDEMITRFGECFDWVELWNEPNNSREWDESLDPEWFRFCEMIGAAAYWAQQRGKKTLLGGMSPIDPTWLRLLFHRNVMNYIDAVGVHGFPTTFEFWWDGWPSNIAKVREMLDVHNCPAEIWITETGYSTFRHDEREQVTHFLAALDAPVDRVYWYAARDLNPRLPTVDGFHSDEREYFFGMKRSNGTPKLLFRLWAEGGLPGVRQAAWLTTPVPFTEARRGGILITGGAGFIGTNLADRLLGDQRTVTLLDNLSRPGVERNVQWLREKHESGFRLEVVDIRDIHRLRKTVSTVEQVYHFAAQVAVTTSLADPQDDFSVNAQGTLNLLEAIRECDNPPSLVLTSTNKVYGGLDDVTLRLANNCYEPADERIRRSGISEERPLDFHSPYGCSKGSADQYVRDYARVYGLKTLVFRMSCIYGPHQFGTEDQGWVAHFLIQSMNNQRITLYGDGRQVRDVLFVEDLVNALLLAQREMDRLSGQAFNIGGGPRNTISLLQLLDMIEALDGKRPSVAFDEWRPGDQRYYVSDTSQFHHATGWSPRVDVREGVQRLYEWLNGGLKARRLPRKAPRLSTRPLVPTRPGGEAVLAG